jgi:hypothetical protein
MACSTIRSADLVVNTSAALALESLDTINAK